MKLKHGYIVKGMYENGQEFSYGKCDTKHQVLKSYQFALKSPHVSDEVKKTLRIVELVEHDITDELMATMTES